MNVELSEATQLIYLEKMVPVARDVLRAAVELTIQQWTHPSQMPPIAVILGHIDEVEERKALQASDSILDRQDKPPEWEQLRQNAKVTREEMAQWLEQGKQKQRERIAKLEANPKWQEMAKRLGAMPGLSNSIKESQVPSDSEECKAWAHAKAIEQGLIRDGQ